MILFALPLLKLTVILALGLIIAKTMVRRSPAQSYSFTVLALTAALAFPFMHFVRPLAQVGVIHLTVTDVRVAAAADSYEITHWANIVWVGGVLVMLLRHLGGILYFQLRLRKHALEFHEPNATASVYLAPVSVPVAFGWWQPAIYLPLSARDWEASDRKMAIAHERAHIRRGDQWTGILLRLTEAVYWFHPFTWWLIRIAEDGREKACDEHVLRSGVTPASYAQLLIDLARQLTSARLVDCPMLTNKAQLKGRIMQILNCKKTVPFSRRASLAIALGAIFLLGGAVAIPMAADVSASDPAKIYKIGGDVKAPKILKKVEPAYSKASADAHLQGTVVLNAVIDASGGVGDVHVTKGLAPDLDANAIKAVRTWQFSPATRNGAPVAVSADIEINFQLK